MPNNFKILVDNAIYVSKAGNDSNSGISPESPKLTIQAGVNAITSTYRTLIVGAGEYSENISYTGTNFSQLIGDGSVIINGNNVYTLFLGVSTVKNILLKNIRFGFNSISTYSIITPQLTTQYLYIGNLSCAAQGPFGGQGFIYENCIFVNSNMSNLGSYTYTLLKCIVINSYFEFSIGQYSQSNYLTVKSNYIDSTSVISFSSGYSGNGGLVTHNNIEGKVVVFLNGAVSGVNSNGVALSFAQHRIDYPTFNLYSFSQNPKFNNPKLLDFTLQAGSPNISASSDYVSNIGGTEYAVPFTASSAAFTTNATSQSLEYRGNLYYAISGSEATGSITSGPMFLQWPRTKPMTSINWIGALEFNKTITASLAGNNNVPAYTTFTSASGQAGANPDRLKIRMRFSTQQTQPATDAEWDNNGYWPAGTYQLFEPNTKPKVDYKGTGNGDPTYVETSAIGDLVPSWVQTQIVLRNDYNR